MPEIDRDNIAKYLTIAKLKLENAISVVRRATQAGQPPPSQPRSRRLGAARLVGRIGTVRSGRVVSVAGASPSLPRTSSCPCRGVGPVVPPGRRSDARSMVANPAGVITASLTEAPWLSGWTPPASGASVFPDSGDPCPAPTPVLQLSTSEPRRRPGHPAGSGPLICRLSPGRLRGTRRVNPRPAIATPAEGRGRRGDQQAAKTALERQHMATSDPAVYAWTTSGRDRSGHVRSIPSPVRPGQPIGTSGKDREPGRAASTRQARSRRVASRPRQPRGDTGTAPATTTGELPAHRRPGRHGGSHGDRREPPVAVAAARSRPRPPTGSAPPPITFHVDEAVRHRQCRPCHGSGDQHGEGRQERPSRPRPAETGRIGIPTATAADQAVPFSPGVATIPITATAAEDRGGGRREDGARGEQDDRHGAPLPGRRGRPGSACRASRRRRPARRRRRSACRSRAGGASSPARSESPARAPLRRGPPRRHRRGRRGPTGRDGSAEARRRGGSPRRAARQT